MLIPPTCNRNKYPTVKDIEAELALLPPRNFNGFKRLSIITSPPEPVTINAGLLNEASNLIIPFVNLPDTTISANEPMNTILSLLLSFKTDARNLLTSLVHAFNDTFLLSKTRAVRLWYCIKHFL